MNKKRQKLIKVDLLCANGAAYETYSELYDRKIQEIQKDLDLKLAMCEANSTYDKTMKCWMLDESADDAATIKRPDPIEGVPTQAWIAITQGTKEDRKKYKTQVIERWKAEALAQDKRVLESVPFSNVLCPACQATMKYDWSIIYDRGTLEKSDEKVLHTYICPRCEKREAIFEDGIRWATNSGGRCFFCQSIRMTTVTKDDHNNIFLIHTCNRCQGTQVEQGDHGLS